MLINDLEDEAIWLAFRDQALQPLECTDLVTTEQTRKEFIEGCRLLALTEVFPHQLLIADALNAGIETTGIVMPRQSGKTKTLTILVLGRCSLRTRYNVAMTLATLSSKTSEVFVQTVIEELELAFPHEATRPFKLYRGRGSENVKFPNGSRFSAKSPKGSSFRASSYDFIWVDEGGETTPEQGEDLKAGIYSTFDTREGAQLVITGTAAKFRRAQMLYEALATPGNGVVRYALAEDVTADETVAWEPTDEFPYANMKALTESMHPGVACGLTTIEKVEKRFNDLGSDRYLQEYGGIFGVLGEGAGVIDQQVWFDSGRDVTPDVPERFSLAVMPSFYGASASIVAAWRDEEGVAHGFVLNHAQGTTWLADAAATKSRQHNVPIIYDRKSSDMRIEVEAMERMTPKPWLEPQGFDEVTSAAALLIKEINRGMAMHYRQPALENAAKIAVRRSTGPNSWALGRPPRDKHADISALEAWALALRYFDDNPTRKFIAPIMAA